MPGVRRGKRKQDHRDILLESYVETMARVTDDLRSFLNSLFKLKNKFEELANNAEATASEYEKQAGGNKQARTVPDQQLASIKAQHWRIVANWLREASVIPETK